MALLKTLGFQAHAAGVTTFFKLFHDGLRTMRRKVDDRGISRLQPTAHRLVRNMRNFERSRVFLCKSLSAGVVLGCSLLAQSCGAPDENFPAFDRFRYPTAFAQDPAGDWLYISQGNWDRAEDYSALVSIPLAPLDQFLKGSTAELPPGCIEGMDPDSPVFCAANSWIDKSRSLIVPSGAGTMMIDRVVDSLGFRILLLTRHQSSLTWIDAEVEEFGLPPRLECGQGSGRLCRGRHVLGNLEREPARIYPDAEGFRFAYVPHLLERRLSLIWLDGPEGPEVVDLEDEFFREDPIHDSGLSGGFGMAQIPCRPELEYVPAATAECTRPYLYASQRFWFGLRSFSIAPGRKVILTGGEIALEASSQDATAPLPTMGAVKVDAPSDPKHLIVLQNEPPVLMKLDIALADGRPLNRVVDAVGTCARADLVELVYFRERSPIAVVSCPADGHLAVYDLATLHPIRDIPLGAGANEMHLDDVRRGMWVANTSEHSISWIDLNPNSAHFLRERLVIGHEAARKRVFSE